MFKKFASLLEKPGIVRVKQTLRKYLESDLYTIVVLAAAVINWKLHTMAIVMAVGLLHFFLIFFLDVDRIRLIPLVPTAIISLRLENNPDYLWPAVIAAVIVFPIVVYDLFRRKVNFNNKIFIGMVFILIAMCFSFVNAPDFITPLMGFAMMFFYVFLFLYMFNKATDKEKLEDNRLYLTRTFNYMALAIFIEVLLLMFETNAFADLNEFFTEKQVKLGWAMTNFIAMILLMIMPLSVYYYIKNQDKYILLLYVLIELALLFLMMSRGAYLAILITAVPFLVKFTTDIKDKVLFTKVLMIALIFILLFTLTVLIPKEIVKNYFNALDERGLSLTGREIIYKVGMMVFKQYPLFGGGVYTSEFFISRVANTVYYHNYLIQTLATIGIVGLAAFLYYLYQVLRAATRRDDYCIYVLFIVLNMMIHGLFDTTFYNPLVMVMLSCILPLLNGENNNKAPVISAQKEEANVCC
jgi:O-antigen ligase